MKIISVDSARITLLLNISAKIVNLDRDMDLEYIIHSDLNDIRSYYFGFMFLLNRGLLQLKG